MNAKRFPCYILIFLMYVSSTACMQLKREIPEGKEIFQSASLSLDRPFWSENNELIAFSGFDAVTGQSQVFILNTNTMQVSRIYQAPRLSVNGWSVLNSDELLISTREEIGVLDSDLSGEPQLLTTGTLASWSPDGKSLAVVDRENTDKFLKIWNTGQKTDKRILDDKSFKNIFDVSWSQDGTRILLAAMDLKDELVVNLFMVDMQENELTQVTFGNDGDQNINPLWINHDKILFLQRNIYRDKRSFVIYDLSTKCEEKIPTKPISSFSISPDKKMMVYVLENRSIGLSTTSFISDKLSDSECK